MLCHKYNRILLFLFTLVCLQSFSQSGSGDKKQEQFAQLKSFIDSRKFQFKATSATSMKGMTRQLTSEYFIKLNTDSLSVDLPYYGRSYTTSYPPTDLSTSFVSNQFTYVADSLKKGGWEISIVPKNQANASKINMSVTVSGYCTVRVSSNSRQPISYYGKIVTYDAR